MTLRYLLFGTHSYAYEILRPLQAAIRRRGDEAAWFLESSVTDQLRADETRIHDAAGVRAFNPDAVLVPGNAVPDFFPGIKVQVFHGFGIEKKGHFRIRGWFDLYCTHGPLTTEPFRELARRHGHFAVEETGWPKMDLLFSQPAGPDWKSRFKEPGRPLILYAPTFSPSLTSVNALADEIERLAGNGKWNWLVKFHPKMDPYWVDRISERQGPTLKVAETTDIVGLLHAADLLLSDTSSVIAEFLLLDKPAVTFRNSRPGPHLLDFTHAADLEAMLESALARQGEDRAVARDFANAMHPYRDGKSSERVLDAVEKFIREDTGKKLKPKPANLWRRLRMRARYRT